MNHPNKTPEQVWKEYVIAVAKLDQQKQVTKNLRRLRVNVRVNQTRAK